MWKEARMPRAKILERRYTAAEVEVRSHGAKVFIEGYAAVFGKRSGNLGGFVEVVEPTAFTKTVKEADVRALQNHDANLVLGRTKAGTLELSIDQSGLYYRVLPPNTTYARDLLEVMERGDVNQSSFSFFKVHDDWDLTEEEFPQRHLQEVGLVDVSPVTYPAYEDATSGVGRVAALDGLAKRSGLQIVDLSDEDAIKEAILKFGPGKSTQGEPSNKDTRNAPDSAATRAERAKRALELLSKDPFASIED
jgi:HK97 family phage prohead protease